MFFNSINFNSIIVQLKHTDTIHLLFYKEVYRNRIVLMALLLSGICVLQQIFIKEEFVFKQIEQRIIIGIMKTHTIMYRVYTLLVGTIAIPRPSSQHPFKVTIDIKFTGILPHKLFIRSNFVKGNNIGLCRPHLGITISDKYRIYIIHAILNSAMNTVWVESFLRLITPTFPHSLLD